MKEARKKSVDNLKERNNINWYTVIVFENQQERENFMKEISIPAHERYITEDQVRRIQKNERAFRSFLL